MPFLGIVAESLAVKVTPIGRFSHQNSEGPKQQPEGFLDQMTSAIY